MRLSLQICTANISPGFIWLHINTLPWNSSVEPPSLRRHFLGGFVGTLVIAETCPDSLVIQTDPALGLDHGLRLYWASGFKRFLYTVETDLGFGVEGSQDYVVPSWANLRISWIWHALRLYARRDWKKS